MPASSGASASRGSSAASRTRGCPTSVSRSRAVCGDLAERLMARGSYRNRHALQTGDVEMGRRNCTFRARKLRDQVLP